jgi:hypothetical protein
VLGKVTMYISQTKLCYWLYYQVCVLYVDSRKCAKLNYIVCSVGRYVYGKKVEGQVTFKYGLVVGGKIYPIGKSEPKTVSIYNV